MNIEMPPKPKNIDFKEELLFANIGQENSEEYINYVAEKVLDGQELNETEQAVLNNDANKQKMKEVLERKNITHTNIEEKITENKQELETLEEVSTEEPTTLQENTEEASIKPLQTEPEKTNDDSIKKLRQAEIQAILKEKEDKRDALLQKTADTIIETKRNEYIDAYGKSITENEGILGVKKLAHKIGNWTGFFKKDAFADKKIKDIKDTYENTKNKKGDAIKDAFIEARIGEKKEALLDRMTAHKTTSKVEGSKKTHLWTEDDIKKLERRYRAVVETSDKKNNHEIFKNEVLDLAFVKQENELLRKAKNEAWETNKNKAEQLLQKTGEYIEQKKWLKNTIGNKWFRFALTTGVMGALTGGFSTFFLVNRAARFGGGMTGGMLGKFVGDKWIKENEILNKKLTQLDTDYKSGKINSGEYDNQREQIDLVLERYARLKMLLTSGGAIAGGIGAGAAAHAVENHFGATEHHDTHPQKEDAEKGDTKPLEPKPTESNPQPIVDNNPEQGDDGNSIENTTPPAYSIVEAHSGRGVEHALTADIEHNPDLAKQLGWNGTEDLHRFAQGEAHRIALSEGYVDPNTGAERWVYGDNNVSYNIRMEGNELIVDEKVLENGNWISHDELDSKNDIFEKDTDTSTDKHIYEKIHARSVVHHHAPVFENTDAQPYTGEDEYALEDAPQEEIIQGTSTDEIIQGNSPEDVIQGSAPEDQVIQGTAPENIPHPKTDPVIPKATEPVGYKGPELPRTYGGGAEESGYGFPSPGRTMTGGGHSVELPKTHGGVNGGGGLFDDILRILLGGK